MVPQLVLGQLIHTKSNISAISSLFKFIYYIKSSLASSNSEHVSYFTLVSFEISLSKLSLIFLYTVKLYYLKILHSSFC